MTSQKISSFHCPVCMAFSSPYQGRGPCADECVIAFDLCLEEADVPVIMELFTTRITLAARAVIPGFESCIHANPFEKSVLRVTMRTPEREMPKLIDFLRLECAQAMFGGVASLIAGDGEFEDITHVEL
ncbi:MAG: hypothetical protein KIH65_000765 [Candidatus Uhrbacteria bacterium]|nr:hypothetical protein [Candidatus Uhrbacteria bacterium]